MKNKNGFTIVELLIVIVILAILMTLIATTFSALSNRSRERLLTTLINKIETAAEKWADDRNLREDVTITVDRLVKDGYLDPDDEKGDVLSPKDKTKLNCYNITIRYEVDEHSNYYAEYTDVNNC